ncbi:hypothetical protein ACF0H5_022911 [Mactra antiquata]
MSMYTGLSCLILYSVLCGFVNTADISTCHNGWLAFEGSCYLFGETAAHFTEAEDFCRKHHNSHLVHIDSDLENKFIKDHLRDHQTHSWWMGLTDQDIEGVWKWFDTDTVAAFTDWDPSQPDPSEEDCGVFWLAFDFKWGDVPCTSSFPPICEMGSLENPGVIGK